MAQPGDVVVVSTNGNTTSAVFGEIMATTAVEVGLGGIIVDGAIRDVDGLAERWDFRLQPDRVPGRMRQRWARGNQCPHLLREHGGDARGHRRGRSGWRGGGAPGDRPEVLDAVRALEAREKKRIAEIRGGRSSRPRSTRPSRRRG